MILLKMSSITPGDSKLPDYPGTGGWFSCNSCNFGVEREQKEGAKAGTDDITIGVGLLKECSIEKVSNEASCTGFTFAIAGGPMKNALIHFVQTKGVGTDQSVYPYMSICLLPAFIKTWTISGSEDGRPTESITLWYRKIGIKYQTYQSDGSGGYTYGAAQMSGWDQVTNKAWAPADSDFK
jgi:type VI protein secretion system component Hcp